MASAELREHLCWLIEHGHAHPPLEAAFAEISIEHRGVRPAGLPWSLWELLEHIRICQWDILEFSRDPKHESPPHPEGYWPDSPAPPNGSAWDASFAAVLADREAMFALIRDPSCDLFAPFPWGDGQTLLREATLIADHNAYHVGQAVAVRRLLGCWDD